jgi:hypothetical protein
VLRILYGPKESAIGWRKLNNEELHNSYSSPNIIRISNQGELVHPAHMRDIINRYTNFVEKVQGRHHFGDLGEDGKIIL